MEVKRGSAHNSMKRSKWHALRISGKAPDVPQERVKATEGVGTAIAALALVVSFAALYLQSIDERCRLTMRIMEFTFEPRGDAASPICRLDVALYNSGNRDAALVRASLLHGRVAATSSGYDVSSAVYPGGEASPAYVPTTLKGGELRFVTLTFPGCQVDDLRTDTTKRGYVDLSLKTEALSYRGEQATAYTRFASTELANGDMAFHLSTEGSFDLLADRAQYAGVSHRMEKVLRMKGRGKQFEQRFESNETHRGHAVP